MSDETGGCGGEVGVAEVEDPQAGVGMEGREEVEDGLRAERVAAQREQLEGRVTGEQGGEVGGGVGAEAAAAEPQAAQAGEVEVGQEVGDVALLEVEVTAREDGAADEMTRTLEVGAEVGEEGGAVVR